MCVCVCACVSGRMCMYVSMGDWLVAYVWVGGWLVSCARARVCVCVNVGGWLVSCELLAEWVNSWLTDWHLVDWVNSWLAQLLSWVANLMGGWLGEWLAGWLGGRLAYWLAGWPVCCCGCFDEWFTINISKWFLCKRYTLAPDGRRHIFILFFILAHCLDTRKLYDWST